MEKAHPDPGKPGPAMSIHYPQRWYTCALCQESTQHAVAGNRLLSRWDMLRLPSIPLPMFSQRNAELARRCPSSALASFHFTQRWGGLASIARDLD